MVTPEIIKISSGQKITKQEVVDCLLKLEYVEDKLVGRPGEYASRGTVLDVFPVSFRKPVRIVFDLDQIDSIRDFSVHSGQSMMSYDEVRLIAVTKAFARRVSRISSFLSKP